MGDLQSASPARSRKGAFSKVLPDHRDAVPDETEEVIERSRQAFFALGAVEEVESGRMLHGSQLALSKIIKMSAGDEHYQFLQHEEVPHHVPMFGHSPMQLYTDLRSGGKPKDMDREKGSVKTQQALLPWERRLHTAGPLPGMGREPPKSTFINAARL